MKTILNNLSLTFFLLLSAHQASAQDSDSASAVFAGGCFWCIEADFEKVNGVTAVVSGYTGGDLKNPTYRDVTRGDSGHYEAVTVYYDPALVSYAELLAIFWVNIDPLDERGQFCDKGPSYRSAIFTMDDTQHQAALKSLTEAQQTLGKDQPIITPILPAATFYPAEDYHQDYYQKNPVRYKYYRWNCGRDARLEALWGKR